MIAFISFVVLLVGILMSAFSHLRIMARSKRRGRRLLGMGIVVSIAALAGVGWGVAHAPKPQVPVTDFSSCVAAGNPIMESYPEQCHDSKNGRIFMNTSQVVQKLQKCPDHWYLNQMPVGTDMVTQEYFIYDNKRVEKSAVDVEWVTANCPTKAPEKVY